MKSKEQKRREAAERQAVCDARPVWERALILADRPGESRKELARLGLVSMNPQKARSGFGPATEMVLR